MRLREIQDLLTRGIPLVDATFEVVVLASHQQGGVIKRTAGQLREGLRLLAQVPTIDEPAKVTLRNALLVDTESSATPRGPHAIAADLHSQIRSIVFAASQLLAVINSILPNEDSLEICIRIPPTSNLSELSSTVRELESIFDQPARRVLKNGLNFVGFDRGSDWILLAASTVLVYRLTLAIIGACHKYMERQRSLETTELLMKELESFSSDLRAAAGEGLKKLGRTFARDALASVSEGEPESEDVEVTLIAVERLAALYAKQLDIRLALNAPKEEADKFPTVEELARLLPGVPEAPQLPSSTPTDE